MSALNLLRRLEAQGVRLWAKGDALAFDGPEDVLSDDLIEKLRAAKAELLSALAPEPALAKALADPRLTPFQEIWCIDFEFIASPGERPRPVCLVAKELRSERTVRQWRDGFGTEPPYAIGPDSLFVAFSANADLGCHLALGWPMPEHVLDLYIEARRILNGKR